MLMAGLNWVTGAKFRFSCSVLLLCSWSTTALPSASPPRLSESCLRCLPPVASPPSALAWASPSWCWPVALLLPWVLPEWTELSCSTLWSPSLRMLAKLNAGLNWVTGAKLTFSCSVLLSCSWSTMVNAPASPPRESSPLRCLPPVASPPSAVASASASWLCEVLLLLPWVLLEWTELSCSMSWSPSEPNPADVHGRVGLGDRRPVAVGLRGLVSLVLEDLGESRGVAALAAGVVVLAVLAAGGVAALGRGVGVAVLVLAGVVGVAMGVAGVDRVVLLDLLVALGAEPAGVACLVVLRDRRLVGVRLGRGVVLRLNDPGGARGASPPRLSAVAIPAPARASRPALATTARMRRAFVRMRKLPLEEMVRVVSENPVRPDGRR